MKVRITSSSSKFFSVISIALIAIVMAFLLAPNAVACHKGKPHGKDKTPCGGGGGTLGENFNTALFDHVHGCPDSCVEYYFSISPTNFERSPGSSIDSGDYLMTDSSGPLVDLSTNVFTTRQVLKGGKNGDLCHAMDVADPINPLPEEMGPLVAQADSFSYGWTEDCTGGGCDVEISLSVTGPEVSTMTGGRSDRVEMLMTANWIGATSDEPFSTDQSVEIEAIVLDFKKPGTTRTLTRCRLGGGNAHPQLITTDLP